MAQCPTCSKFASYDEEPEISVNDAEFDSGTISGSLTATLKSACCGDTLKEGDVEFEFDLLHPNCDDPSECEIEVEEYDAENFRSDRRRGKTVFLADVVITLKCPCKIQDSFTVTHTVEINPADLDDCT